MSTSLKDILSEEEVDYESDTVFHKEEEPPATSLVLPCERAHTPNLLTMVHLLTASTSSQSVEPDDITNRLDEEQDQLLADEYKRRESLTLASKPS